MDVCEISPEKYELMGTFAECGPLLSAIGDENRQTIICVLILNPGQRVEEIRAHTNLSRPAVSHHLKILKDSGVVTIVRKGTKNYYFPNCDMTAWIRLKILASKIYDLAESVSRDAELGTKRMAMIDEFDV